MFAQGQAYIASQKWLDKEIKSIEIFILDCLRLEYPTSNVVKRVIYITRLTGYFTTAELEKIQVQTNRANRSSDLAI